MARETKAEKSARLDAERLGHEARELKALQENWSEKLLKKMLLARSEGLHVSLDLDHVTFCEQYRIPVTPPKTYDEINDVLDEFWWVDHDIEEAKSEREYEARLGALRKSALAKLTTEEREALGV